MTKKTINLKLSNLPKTWIFDLDGTIVKHNGYLIDKKDTLLNGVQDFFSHIPKNDYVIITTARQKCYSKETEDFLTKNHIRFDTIIYDLPTGERILLNDDKPRGLKCGYVVNSKRDEFPNINIEYDDNI